MAWSLISTGATATLNGAGPLSVNAPATITSGNLLLMHYFGFEANFGVPTITLPSPWNTQIVQNITDAASDLTRNLLAWKIATGSEPGSYSVSWNRSVNASIFITQFSGNAASPFDTSSQNLGAAGGGSSPLNISATALMTANAGELLIWQGIGCSNNNSTAVASPASYLPLGNGTVGGVAAQGAYRAAYIVGGGAGSSGTPTGAYTFAGTDGWTCVLGAFIAGAVAGTTTWLWV